MKRTHRLLFASLTVVMLAVVLVLVASGGQPSLAEGGVIYVDADADPGGDGASWGTAFADLQDALDAAAAVAPVEIWVASGTYTPTWQFDPEDPRSATFQMANGVAIYGGFAGTETERDQRNWFANPTILSGDLSGNDLPDFTNSDENSYHVFYHPDGTSLDDTAILDGFTITGGNADGDVYPDSTGGGMYNYSCSPTLTNCVFSGNSADFGGGIDNEFSAPTLSNCTFSGNSAYWVGGGMRNDNDSRPTLTDCTFTGNLAQLGAGIFSLYSSPILTNCILSHNLASESGGGMYNDDSSPTLANSVFESNSAPHAGGMANLSSSPILTNCVFEGNSATFGGGAILNFYSASPTLTNCVLWGNSPEQVYNNEPGSTPSITYSDVQGGCDADPLNICGDGNIDEDPQFVDAANGDLRLQLTSPAIDAGDNSAVPITVTTDLGGHPRFADVGTVDDTGNGDPPVVDMGAYEAPPEVIYVDQDAVGENDGSSWDDALISFQDALTWAVDGVEIWVAEGTYKPTSGDDRAISFQMVNGVSIYGGFDPSTGDTEWEDRDWASNVTILSGDIGTEGNPADNSYHVFFHPSELALDGTAVLDGFTISGGNANVFPLASGGGMYNNFSSPTLANINFADNSALDGGGMFSYESSPTLTNCIFQGNSATDGGGMLSINAPSPAPAPTLTNCTFQGNSATRGGGMVNNGPATLTNCAFHMNWADDDGGGIYNPGLSEPTLTNCTFTGNSATRGGGMYNDSSPTLTDVTFTGNGASGSGGGMENTSGSSPTLTNCTFQGNTAVDEGGGMHNDGSTPILTGCTFSANTADAGGGMHNGSSSPTLTNVTFAGNGANSGGGMHNNSSSPVLVNCTFWGNSAQGKGGGMRNKTGSAPTLTNCTFYGNTATDGGAMQNYELSSPVVTNCILWGDSSPEIDNTGDSTTDVTYSDVEGSPPNPIMGNINADPRFADPESGNFHLLPGSPCIDAGTDTALFLPDEDFEGDPRSMDGDGDGTSTSDMGVDEAWPPVYLPLVLRGY